MKYFTISEFIKSDTALKMRIWNGANKEIEENIRALVDNVLDPLRELYGHPIDVTSGYRCPKLNNAVNGAPNSQHMRGEAADIVARPLSAGDRGSASAMTANGDAMTTKGAAMRQSAGYSPTENLKLAQMIAEAGKFDQMILEEVGPNDLLPKWIHVTWKRNGWNRRNILKKVAGKAGYIVVRPEQLRAADKGL